MFHNDCIFGWSIVNVVPIVALYSFTNFCFSRLLALLQRFTAIAANMPPVRYGQKDSGESERFLCVKNKLTPPNAQVKGLLTARLAFPAIPSFG